MRTTTIALRVALVVASTNSGAWSADRMVGVVPTDGSTMLVKRFSVDAGTTITGVQFENNDEATTFPEIALLRGPLTSIAGGTVVATASNVRRGTGVATVSWPSAVSVATAGAYYVAVRFPSGPGRQGTGQGPALGANDVTAPNGTYVAGNASAPLVPVRTDLAISLVKTSSKAGVAIPSEPPALVQGSFLRVRSTDGGFPATVSFGLGEPAEVVVSVYDVAGRLVRKLLAGTVAAGSHENVWDGRDEQGGMTAAGVYIVRLQRKEGVLTQKLAVAR